MADSTSVTANLKSQILTDWLPTIAWVRQGNGWETMIAFAPGMVTTQPDQFSIELRFFKDAQLLGAYHAGPVTYPQTLRVSVGNALCTLGIPEYDGIVEVYTRGTGPWSEKQRVKCILDVWMEIHSVDGCFRVVGPTGQFAGSPRVRGSTLSAYEFYPGVPVGGPFTTDLLLMNPYTIPVRFRVNAYKCSGQMQPSVERIVPRRHYIIAGLAELLPDIGSYVPRVASLSIVSRYKLPVFCLFRNELTGEVTAMDHTWPFLEFRREN